MKSVKSIKNKAIFLLIVFSLNTIVAFACSLGMDMGYNSHFHGKDSKKDPIHTHGGGNKHVHPQEDATHGQSAAHGHNKSHAHSHGDVKHTQEHKDDKDNCCKEKAKEFQEIDKVVPGLPGINYLDFFATFDFVYRTITLLPYANVVRDVKPFVRNNHPPIPDIRIAIQSFQI